MAAQPALDTQNLAALARACAGTPEQRTLISPEHPLPMTLRSSTSTEERFELFHFVFSVCSQKVRAVLAELKIPYASNELVIFPPNENYCPAYVALRLEADVAKASTAATSFSGKTSVELEGIDGLVVPTLVDHESGKVVADSKAICYYLCDASRDAHGESEQDLVPDAMREAIEQQLQIVDEMPQAALLYGANPDGDTRPEHMRGKMTGVHAVKIAGVERHLASLSDDHRQNNPALVAAYENKIAKEQAAAEFVVDEARMREVVADTDAVIADLEAHLGVQSGDWVLGSTFTLADLFWAVSLYRLQWLGYSGMWRSSNRSRVDAYAARLFARPSIQSAIIRWPGHPPSEQTSHLL